MKFALQPLPPAAGVEVGVTAQQPLLQCRQTRERDACRLAQARGVQVAEDEDEACHGGIVTGMRLLLDNDPQVLTVRGYAPGEIDVAGQLIRAPCILSAARLVTDWPVRCAAELDLAALEPLMALHPNVVLIGTDAADLFAVSALRKAVEARGVAFEIMSVGAACRTFNVLAQERREVVAGLFP